MLLWDPDNAMGLEAPALSDLADRLSECSAVQLLNRAAGDAAAAREKITVCAETDPWDDPDGKFTVRQLEEMKFSADIAPAFEGMLEALRKVGDPEGRCPDMSGSAAIYLRAQFDEHDIVDNGRDGCMLWFLDLSAAVLEQLHLRVDSVGRPTITGARRVGRPLWNEDDSQTAQGHMIFAFLEVDWGSPQKQDA
jgi:hypothetical protein